ncbi:putative ORFan [Tupanvirus deep ocean]|uniref:ORFan n=2 Tax=Tupanvirus TaxID=2094720 RepID=A0AC62AA66_9VIRU|nr:putative ORFan [Tupanvirus deep ocean]QKU34543.1 putative ORFan [Tupanvirus deep ocean]
MSYLVNIRLVFKPTPKHLRTSKNSLNGHLGSNNSSFLAKKKIFVSTPNSCVDGYIFPSTLDLIHNPKKTSFIKSTEDEYKRFPSVLKMLHSED